MYSQRGWLNQISLELVEDEKKRLLEDCRHKSDDADILALARVSNTTLLVTDDEDLRDDFEDPAIVENGVVYRREEESSVHLLRKHVCKG